MELDGASTSVKLMDVQTFDKDIKLQSARVTKQDQSPFLYQALCLGCNALGISRGKLINLLFYIK